MYIEISNSNEAKLKIKNYTDSILHIQREIESSRVQYPELGTLYGVQI